MARYSLFCTESAIKRQPNNQCYTSWLSLHVIANAIDCIEIHCIICDDPLTQSLGANMSRGEAW